MKKEKSKLKVSSGRTLNFGRLVGLISEVNETFAVQASRAVNVSLTLRNWLFGLYITEYEQHGKDRAEYGEALLAKLADELARLNVSRSDERELRRYRLFYATYPQIRESLPPEFKSIRQADSGVGDSQIVQSKTISKLQMDGQTLLTRLSFTHIAEMLTIDDALKRAFYEVECIQGNWSVRELKRQINSLYYERCGLSTDKKKLAGMTKQKTERASSALNVRDPYVFEFLGLKPREVMSESHLEDELISKIEEFLLELGHGFCFEARQKRILIDDEHYFVDLVFYHRILKCHILVELKLAEFSHENIGQLNTYVSWYRKNVMTEGDNPPIGILLCTNKKHSLVEFALAGMDNKLFVSKYQLELPKRKEIEQFLEKKLKEAGGTNE